MAYRIFISHVWRVQNTYYWGLIRLLGAAKRFSFVDLSIPKFRPLDGSYLDVRDDIRRALRTADVVLTINTPVITNSDSVQDELTEAEKLGLPIIAISPPKRYGAMRESQFGAVQRARRAQWTTKDIVDAIREAARGRTRRQQTADLDQQAYEPADAVADVVELSQIEVASVLGDDEPPIIPETSSQLTPAETTPSPRAMLSRDFMPLLSRGSLGT